MKGNWHLIPSVAKPSSISRWQLDYDQVEPLESSPLNREKRAYTVS